VRGLRKPHDISSETFLPLENECGLLAMVATDNTGEWVALSVVSLVAPWTACVVARLWVHEAFTPGVPGLSTAFKHRPVVRRPRAIASANASVFDQRAPPGPFLPAGNLLPL
jgi:hypothetical protein